MDEISLGPLSIRWNGLLIALGVAMADVTVVLVATSPLIAVIIFCRKTFRAEDHETPELKGGLFILFCSAIVVLIIAFPLTNICIGAAAGGWQYRWMERFKGASQESFVDVFGQPTRDHESYLYYGNIPRFSYPHPDGNLFVLVENGRIKGFIWD
jgi:hypothetical protein